LSKTFRFPALNGWAILEASRRPFSSRCAPAWHAKGGFHPAKGQKTVSEAIFVSTGGIKIVSEVIFISMTGKKTVFWSFQRREVAKKRFSSRSNRVRPWKIVFPVAHIL